MQFKSANANTQGLVSRTQHDCITRCRPADRVQVENRSNSHTNSAVIPPIKLLKLIQISVGSNSGGISRLNLIRPSQPADMVQITWRRWNSVQKYHMGLVVLPRVISVCGLVLAYCRRGVFVQKMSCLGHEMQISCPRNFISQVL
ncbi:Hypothetical_protein [Hexamita inflata]|uniref:Hypothetical_protein n=1 Tax=Hexamita inflata TaxID=28002 RepID=A0AA86RMV0_9EUKA|nr:Hypothetical protein HINF_LOCUS65383 [Hexamita inflata]